MSTARRSLSFVPLVVVALSALTVTGCWRIAEASIKPPANPVLSGGLGWGVVKDAYVRLKQSPSESARDLDHLRRGDIFGLNARVLGVQDNRSGKASPDDPPTVWYGISSEGSNGWVQDSELEVYASKRQAEKAASAYR